MSRERAFLGIETCASKGSDFRSDWNRGTAGSGELKQVVQLSIPVTSQEVLPRQNLSTFCQ